MQLITDWFKRTFSDPQIVFLTLILAAGFAIVLTMGDMLAPVLGDPVRGEPWVFRLGDRLLVKRVAGVPGQEVALVAGNPVIWKPSDKTPLTALACLALLAVVFTVLLVASFVMLKYVF